MSENARMAKSIIVNALQALQTQDALLSSVLLFDAKAVWQENLPGPAGVGYKNGRIYLVTGPILKRFALMGGIKALGWIGLHEVTHLLSDHHKRIQQQLHRASMDLLNVAADLAVEDRIGPPPPAIAKLIASTHARQLTGTLPTFEDYVDKLLENQEELQDIIQGAGGMMAAQGGPEDWSGTWGIPESDGQDDRLEQQVEQALEQVKDRGLHPGGLTELVKELLKPKSVRLRFVASLISSVPNRPSWSRINKRKPLVNPGMRKQRKASAIIAWDTSGSMGQNDLGLAVGQVLEIVSQLSSFVLVMFDANIQAVKKFKSSSSDAKVLEFAGKAIGRGGTDFAPVLEWRNEHYPRDPLVIITDGYAPIPPQEVCKNVIWLITDENMMGEFRKSGLRAYYLKPAG